MPRPRAVDQAQLGFDETQISDAPLEQALEERQARKAVLGEARKSYKEAHEAASTEIAKLELPDDKAVRCGRFRITRTAVSARHVEFDTDPTSRVRITLLEADEADLPTVGEVAESHGNGAMDAPPKRPDPTHLDTLRNRAADARQITP
jgi:hypothetical protein